MTMMEDDGGSVCMEVDDYEEGYGDGYKYNEDEDLGNLSKDIKYEYLAMFNRHEGEPYFYYIYERFFSMYSFKHPNYFKQIKRDAKDDDFLRQLVDAQVSWNKQHTYPKHARETLAKDVVINKLHWNVKCSTKWIAVRARLLDANPNDEVYTNTIKAAANLLCSLHTNDSLYRFGRKRTLHHQKVALWDEIALLLEKSCPVYEAFEKIVQLTSDKDKYSFLTECELADIICGYHSQLQIRCSDRPIAIDRVDPPLSYFKAGEDAMEILNDIDKVVEEMDLFFPKFQLDKYVRVLVELLRGEDFHANAGLVIDAMKIVNTNAVDQRKAIYSLLDRLVDSEIDKMKSQLTDVVQPLFILSIEILGRRFVSHEILVIVQVAELRRMALGSRFIGRSHLIWAFYECGYGLPKIRNVAYSICRDKDHPPYHVYVAAMKLAAASELTKVRLEHFMFAVLFAQESIFNWSKKQWSEMQQEFMYFVKELETQFV